MRSSRSRRLLPLEPRLVEGDRGDEVEHAVHDRQRLGSGRGRGCRPAARRPSGRRRPAGGRGAGFWSSTRQAPLVADPDRDQGPLVEGEVDVVRHEEPEGVGRVLGLGRVPLVEQLVGQPFHDGGQQAGLAGEVEVQRRAGDTGRFADVVHADVVEPRLVEQGAGDVEDLRLTCSGFPLRHVPPSPWSSPCHLELLGSEARRWRFRWRSGRRPKRSRRRGRRSWPPGSARIAVTRPCPESIPPAVANARILKRSLRKLPGQPHPFPHGGFEDGLDEHRVGVRIRGAGGPGDLPVVVDRHEVPVGPRLHHQPLHRQRKRKLGKLAPTERSLGVPEDRQALDADDLTGLLGVGRLDEEEGAVTDREPLAGDARPAPTWR